MFGFLKFIIIMIGLSQLLVFNNLSAQETSSPKSDDSLNQKSQVLISKNQSNFINMEYFNIKPNTIKFIETAFCSIKVLNARCKQEDKLLNISIDIKNSASPLFYKLNKKVKSLELSGEIKVISPIDENKDDTYFQIGLVYEGTYRPNFLIKIFFPKWLQEILDLYPNKGIENIYFYEVSDRKDPLKKTTVIKKVKIHFDTSTYIIWQKNKKPLTGLFNIKVLPEQKNILGLWLRSDGDNSKASFNTTITNFTLE